MLVMASSSEMLLIVLLSLLRRDSNCVDSIKEGEVLSYTSAGLGSTV